MPETPKENPAPHKRKKDADEGVSSGEDRSSGKYYYDDAHGYETFDPDKEMEDDDPTAWEDSTRSGKNR